ncbi:hypothetical protein [Streptomyces sp. bgisy060]|uniref:hypothetical protein n=1 Tax=Streptomyces sp. bgisy060 TaxID=3413775 RepID=UPI003EB786D9
MPLPTSTDRALMLLPYDEWISIPAAIERVGLDEDTTNRLVRAGRRRGILRTRGHGQGQQVMRIHTRPRRT